MGKALPVKAKVESGVKIPAIIAQILESRGLNGSAVEPFLNPSYEEHLHDPYLLTDMKPAVERILEAVKKRQEVVIYGDYDIDGLTATALLGDVLSGLGLKVSTYIPDRFEEGYGMNQAALEKLKAKGVELVISVDCGIGSIKEAKWAKENGLDLIITDHHMPGSKLPQTAAVINPKRPGDKYPFKDLSGVGVAFKLAQALQSKSGYPALGREKWLLDLVALGTACDMVPLIGENRALVKYGLKVLSKSRRPGLKALADVGGVGLADVASYHLGFILGPRLNASGRLEHAACSLELLTTTGQSEAFKIATKLDQLNSQRRQEQAKILKAADEQAAKYLDDPVLVLEAPDWSHGIVGIVASKLVEKWRKPTLVMQVLGKEAKGSARSTGWFDLTKALAAADQYLLKYGGHFFAAGYTLEAKDIVKLRRVLNDYYRKLHLAEIDPDTRRTADAEIENLGQVNWDLYGWLKRLEPFGHGNPVPIFRSQGVKILNLNRVGREQSHLKLNLADSLGQVKEVIGFGLAEQHPNLKSGQLVDVHYQVSRNDYLGRSSLQLILTDLK